MLKGCSADDLTKRTMYAEYRGMSYEQASREGLRLLTSALETAYWMDLPEQLIKLRDIMNREKDMYDRSMGSLNG